MELCLLNLLILIVLCIILTLVCPFRACYMWLTMNHMFIREIWGKFTSFIFWNFEISLVWLGRFRNSKKVKSVNLSQISPLNMWLLVLITRLIVTDTAPLTCYFVIVRYFVRARSLIWNCPLLIDIFLRTDKTCVIFLKWFTNFLYSQITTR